MFITKAMTFPHRFFSTNFYLYFMSSVIFISQHFDQQIALFDRNKTVANSLATDKITVSKYGKKKELKQSLGYGDL